MANEILNKVAQTEQMRRGSSAVVRSLGWGPWAGGMVSADMAARFTARGVPLLPLERGAAMLVAETVGTPDAPVELVLWDATEGSLWVDDRRIYEAKTLGMRIESGKPR